MVKSNPETKIFKRLHACVVAMLTERPLTTVIKSGIDEFYAAVIYLAKKQINHKEVIGMSSAANNRKIKDLTVREFKDLIQESIAEDIEAWKETFEILTDKALMRQITAAENARKERKSSEYIPWEKVKRNVSS
jgi:arginase family enzyme